MKKILTESSLKVGQKKIKVALFFRKPHLLGNFSLESYFHKMAILLSQDFEIIQVQVPYPSTGFFPRLFNALYCAFQQGDLNHITGDIHYVAAFMNKHKTLLTVHDCGMIEFSRGLKRSVLKFFWFTLPSWKVNYITTNSEATKKSLLQHISFDPTKIRPIYVCVPDFYERSQPNFNHSTSKRILQIGTAPNKNIFRLADALQGLDIVLTIVGQLSAVLMEHLVKRDIKFIHKNYKLTDAEVFEEYIQCDILAFVSTLEGFGMPIVEAQKVGRVVVTSNLYSMPEVAGEAAIFVDPYDVQSIRNGFLKAIENQDYVQQLILKGFQNATRFGSKAIARHYAALYNEMITSKIA